MEEALRQLVQQWATAEERGDAHALGAILAEDFMAVGPRGFVLTKEQWIGRYASGDLVPETFRWTDGPVRRWGDTAVVIGTQSSSGHHQGRPVGGQFRVTLVCVHEGHDWRLVGAQLSPTAEGA